MKHSKIKHIVILTVAAGIIAISSCSKDDQDTPDNTPETENMVAVAGMNTAFINMSLSDDSLTKTTHHQEKQHHDKTFHHHDSIYKHHHTNYHHEDTSHHNDKHHTSNHHHKYDSLHHEHKKHH